jgi:hypothetical protein
MLFLQEGFTFRNFLVDALAIFVFIVWFWLLITVASDLFRRHDISGWAKAIWVIALIVAPYIGVLAYLIFQGQGMTERSLQRASDAREEIRRVVGFSAADEIEKLDRLKKAGSINEAEFARLRAKLVQ